MDLAASMSTTYSIISFKTQRMTLHWKFHKLQILKQPKNFYPQKNRDMDNTKLLILIEPMRINSYYFKSTYYLALCHTMCHVLLLNHMWLNICTRRKMLIAPEIPTLREYRSHQFAKLFDQNQSSMTVLWA